MEAIFSAVHYIPKYVLDADIAKCFDRIKHDALLAKLNTFPLLHRLIKGWLKSGVMVGENLFPTDEGTPQGGVISPLLANIALHGFETAIKNAFPNHITIDGKGYSRWQPRVIRYADDFVVIHRKLDVIEKAKEVAEEWLSEMGLELKPNKTRIVHTLHEHDGQVGFDFLGFNVRQFPVGKTHWRTGGNNGLILDFTTLITPSKTAIQRHYRRLAEVIDKHKAAPQVALINHLNPIIRGWCNYYATESSKKTFSKMDHLLTKKLLRWVRRRHPHKSIKKVVRKYWNFKHPKRRWDFRADTYNRNLIQHADTPIRRHIKVKETRTPFDGDWVYWGKRMGRHPMLPKRIARLLKQQDGKCTYCGHYFRQDDVLEVDHIVPKSKGGPDSFKNLQLLHGHCHHQKTGRQ